jgi:hypothetical protein
MSEAVITVPESKLVRTFVRIKHDDYPDSPREWDNLGTMVGWHSRRNIGDEQPQCSPDEWVLDLVELDRRELEENWAHMKGINWIGLSSEELKEKEMECARWIHQRVQRELDQRFIMLPLYAYEHGGITFSTGPFSDPWASGQIGYIYVSKAKVREEYGWKVITAKRHAQIREYLDNEVKVYDQWVRGDVYGYELVEVWQCGCCEGKSEEITDSCWGFYGSDWDTNGIKEYLPEEFHDHSEWETPW